MSLTTQHEIVGESGQDGAIANLDDALKLVFYWTHGYAASEMPKWLLQRLSELWGVIAMVSATQSRQ